MKIDDVLVRNFIDGRYDVCVNLCENINSGRSVTLASLLLGFKFADRDHPIPEKYRLGTLSSYWYGLPTDAERMLVVNCYCFKKGNLDSLALDSCISQLKNLLLCNNLLNGETRIGFTDINLSDESKVAFFTKFPFNYEFS